MHGEHGPSGDPQLGSGGPTCLGDQMTVFGLPTTLYQGLGLSEDLFMTASLGSMCGGCRERKNGQHSLGQGAQGPQGRAA